MSDMAKALEDSIPELPPIDTADPGLLWLVFKICGTCLEEERPEDQVQALRIAMVGRKALDTWIKLASEEIDNVQRH